MLLASSCCCYLEAVLNKAGPEGHILHCYCRARLTSGQQLLQLQGCDICALPNRPNDLVLLSSDTSSLQHE